MRILFVTPDIPYAPSGGAGIRVAAFIKALAERHRVSLITFDRDPDHRGRTEQLRRMCEEVVVVPLSERQQQRNKRRYQLLSLAARQTYQYMSHFSRDMQEAIDDYFGRYTPDIVSVEFSQMGYYRYPAGIKKVLDLHNIEHELLRRQFTSESVSIRKLYLAVEWRKFRTNEWDICRKFDCCYTTSEHDKEALLATLPYTECYVIPNGVDTQFYDEQATTAGTGSIVFTGRMDYYPNADAVGYFVQRVLPLIRERLPDLDFYIVGRDPLPAVRRCALQPRVVVTGYLEDIRPYFRKATVVVAPLRVGGGTRLKILEAMAMRRPVVATRVGAEGLKVEHDRNIVLADQPGDLATAVCDLMADPVRRMRLAEAGRTLVEECYAWQSISDRLEQSYRRLLS